MLSIASEASTGDNSLSWIFALTLSIASEDSMGNNPLSWIFALILSISFENLTSTAVIPGLGFLP
jgi:hypothetical protein